MIKLLLADDSITIQRVVELTFSGEDVRVIPVSDGEEAIARIPAERPDIVLADIGMPKRSGYDVSAFVKSNAELSHIPVLLLAGAFEPVDDARAKEVKCDGVLVKPFEPQQVIGRVRELVERRRPAATQHPAEPTTGADEYFDRLDAALETLTSTRPAPSAAAAGDPLSDDRPVPTVDEVLSGAVGRPTTVGAALEFGRVSLPPVEPPDGVPTLTSAPRMQPAAPVFDSGGTNVIADAFSALFAAEQGDATALRRFKAPAPQPAVTDELIETVTRRVLERLAPETAKHLVADIVSEVAERLVRAEIERIRNRR